MPLSNRHEQPVPGRPTGDHTSSVPFHGDPAQAMEVAKGLFASNGFLVELPSPSRLVARGPSMTSTNQNPILGVTRAEIDIDLTSIRVAAELGGVRRMRNFLFLFPPGLALLLTAGFLVSGFSWKHALIPFLAVSPWLVLSPLMSRWVRRRTVRALDAVLHNMASMSGAG